VRILVIADSVFASRERSLLARLEIGLADEGERVIQAIPERVLRTLEPNLFTRGIAYAPRTFVLTRRLAVRRLAQGVEAMLRDEEGGIDIVHVFGGAAWGLATDLARELGAALAVEVWRHGLCERAAKEWDFASGRGPLLFAPDAITASELARRAPRAQVVQAPWGVLPADARAVLEPGRASSIMMIGTGRDAAAFAAALTGIVAASRGRPEVLIFCDADAAGRSGLWRVARSQNVLDRLSLIEDLEARRDLVLEGDIVVHPEASGEQRSTLLEAMAHAVPVVATRDPRVSILVEGVTARLVEGTRAGQWESALGDLLSGPVRARALGASARVHVREHRRASAHVQAVLNAYARLRAPAKV
jgi:hypothetical protein